MIKFMRDKEGNLYSVKNGVVIGKITSIGDKEGKGNGTGSINKDNRPQRRSS